MAKDNELIRQRNKDSAQNAAQFWIELANKRQSEVIHELLAISSVLLPLSTSIIIAKIPLNSTQRGCLITIWCLLLLSIGLGLVQMAIDSDFFVKLSRDGSERATLWSNTNRDINDINKDVEKLGKTPASSPMWPVYAQAILFVLALLGIVTIGISLISRQASSLKSHSSYTQEKQTKPHSQYIFYNQMGR